MNARSSSRRNNPNIACMLIEAALCILRAHSGVYIHVGVRIKALSSCTPCLLTADPVALHISGQAVPAPIHLRALSAIIPID